MSASCYVVGQEEAIVGSPSSERKKRSLLDELPYKRIHRDQAFVFSFRAAHGPPLIRASGTEAGPMRDRRTRRAHGVVAHQQEDIRTRSLRRRNSRCSQ